MAREKGIAGQEEQALALGLLIFAFSHIGVAIRCQRMSCDFCLWITIDLRCSKTIQISKARRN